MADGRTTPPRWWSAEVGRIDLAAVVAIVITAPPGRHVRHIEVILEGGQAALFECSPDTAAELLAAHEAWTTAAEAPKVRAARPRLTKLED